ncbi:hypothetical protein HPP92_003663 [Vanilla planifolia]|uniref:CSC1/OSCA1-like N-terminal transmembrane domain-containing protein n=1 Tax=Vanilla planifolia TaxID=51239 RepID=A0A835S7L0_VANPL|nr:hypothetical protein HPP92_003663 [Vanilla planifolia]
MCWKKIDDGVRLVVYAVYLSFGGGNHLIETAGYVVIQCRTKLFYFHGKACMKQKTMHVRFSTWSWARVYWVIGSLPSSLHFELMCTLIASGNIHTKWTKYYVSMYWRSTVLLRRRIHVVIVPGEREMKLAALLTSAGINIGLCVLFISLYSVLRKQPANVYVYFGRRVTQERNKMNESFNFERFLPTPGWILKAWGPTENEILESAGLDAVVFLRLLVFRKSLHSLSPMMASRRFQAPKDNNGEHLGDQKVVIKVDSQRCWVIFA